MTYLIAFVSALALLLFIILWSAGELILEQRRTHKSFERKY